MKKRVALILFLALGIGVSLEMSVRWTAHAAGRTELLMSNVSRLATVDAQQATDAQFIRLARGNGDADKDNGKVGNGDKSDKPDLRYVDWSKSTSVQKKGAKGDENGNGDGDDEEDEGEKEEEEKEEEEEGFDRLWDVVLYG